MEKAHKKMSLNHRLTLISLSIFLPMVLLVCYLLATIVRTTRAYDATMTSVSYANKYVRDFKERLDYSAYLAVISGRSMESLGREETTVNGIVTVNPYTYIAELGNVCDELAEVATVSSNQYKIRNVKKSLAALNNCVEEMEKSVEQSGNYDANMAYLDENIYALTAIIQSGLQDYIYVETTHLGEIREQMDAENGKALAISAFVCVGGIILSLVLSIYASKSVTRPIHYLCDSLERVAKGDFTTRAEVIPGDEIAVLTSGFNDMTEEIGELVEGIKTEQANLHLTETRLLQAQINPHFLYNTLDTIVWMAEQKQTRDVVVMVTLLSDFFRTTLSEGRDYISIKEEESHVRSYLEIQRLRYQDIMNYEIHIASELYPFMIPKLTLQPLVENALYHGIKNKRGKGTILIIGEKKDDRIILRIIDNGKGMTEAELDRLRKRMNRMDEEEDKSGFGLRNVNQRIQYYYGEEYGVFFESEEGKGTEAVVIMSTKNIIPFS